MELYVKLNSWMSQPYKSKMYRKTIARLVIDRMQLPWFPVKEKREEQMREHKLIT